MRLQAPHHGPDLIRAADGAEEAVSQRRLLVTDDALEKKRERAAKRGRWWEPTKAKERRGERNI